LPENPPVAEGSAPPAWAPTDVDLTRASAARVYDYLLGGSHNFAVDRELAEKARQALPVDQAARANRAFLRRAVHHLAANCGVRQFLDLGSGIPTMGNVHEVVQAVDPAARVVYVDNEPVAVAHGQMLVGDNPNVVALGGDMTDPASILGHPDTRRLIDFSQPVAVLTFAVLHFVPDDDVVTAALAGYRAATCPGSYLALSHGTTDTSDDDEPTTELTRLYRRSQNPVTDRGRAELLALFDGYELLDPGLTLTATWYPDEASRAESNGLPDGTDPRVSLAYCGVGRRLDD
jgi:hypothetical protein